MSVTFTERSPIESGFSDVFEERLVPALTRLEEKRRAHLARAKRHAGIALGAGAVLGVLFLVLGTGAAGWRHVLLSLGIPLLFAGAAGFLLWRRQAQKWQGSAARTVMPVVCDFLGGLDHDHEAHKGFPLERMRKLGVVRPFTKAELSDRLEGTYRDTPFEVVEARLVSKKNQRTSNSGNDSSDRSSKTIFRGLLWRIGVPDPIPTRILIARDYGLGNKLGELLGGSSGRGMPKVDTGHPVFERHFEVYSADPDIARRVLDPGFLDSLLAISQSETGRRGTAGIEAGFHDDSFFMALSREEDFLRMGSLTSPADDIENDLHAVFEDIAQVRRVIDRLHGDHPARA